MHNVADNYIGQQKPVKNRNKRNDNFEIDRDCFRYE